jgi:type IV pilus assembly protein PilA
MKRRSGQAGFTFIELMGVMAIIGVLTCIIMPTVKNYTARAKLTEAINLLTACRTPVTEVFISGNSGQDFPDEWGCEKPAGKVSRYVHTIEVDRGVIKLETANAMQDLRLAPKTITLAPLNRANQPMDENDMGDPVWRWRCGAVADGTDSDLDFSLMPNSCRGV